MENALNQLEKGKKLQQRNGRVLNRHFSEEDIQMTNEHMEDLINNQRNANVNHTEITSRTY